MTAAMTAATLAASKSLFASLGLSPPTAESERGGWWRVPAFVQQQHYDAGFWDTDPALSAFRTLANRPDSPLAGLGALDAPETLPEIAWNAQKHTAALVRIARDALFYTRHVSPEAPLRYLIALLTTDASAAAAWTETLVREVLPLLNGIDQSDDCGVLLVRLLGKVGAVALTPLETYILDTTRTEAARTFAVEAVKSICLIPPLGCKDCDQELVARGAAVIAKALRPFATNRREWNSFLVTTLVDMRAKEAMPVIREAFAARRVDERSCLDYGSTVLDLMGEVDSKDPLVTICQHCSNPEVTCKRKVRADNDAMATLALCEGTELLKQGKNREAFAVLCKAITCATVLSDRFEDCSARYARARCLLNMHRYEEASGDCIELFKLIALKDLWWQAQMLSRVGNKPSQVPQKQQQQRQAAAIDQQASLPDDSEARALMAQLATEEGSQMSSPFFSSSTTASSLSSSRITGETPIVMPPNINWRNAKSEEPVRWNAAHPDSASLSIGEQRFAYISSCCTVEVVPFAYTTSAPVSKASETTTVATTTTQKQPQQPILSRHAKTLVLDAESCGEAQLDQTGGVLATTLLSTHAVVVWELGDFEQPRYVSLGNIPEVPEKVRCGGPKSSIVVATCDSKIVQWNWREPEGPARGPHWLWGAGGPITALVMDSEEDSTVGLSLFACVRETSRSCVLDFSLTSHQLQRTLFCQKPVFTEEQSQPPTTLCAIACCTTHVAAATTSGELIVWERSTAIIVFRVRELTPRPQQLIAAAATAASPTDAAAAITAAAAAAADRSQQGSSVIACCLAFIQGVVLCGLSSGDVVIYGLATHTALARLCGTGELITSLFCKICKDGPESDASSSLLLHVGYIRGIVASRRFPILTDTSTTTTTTTTPTSLPQQPKKKEKKKKKKKKDQPAASKPPKPCSLCGKMTSEYGHCGRCWKETYCSSDCQRKDWRRHKLVCEPRELQ